MYKNTGGAERFIELIPEGVRLQIASLKVVECGFGAGAGLAAIKRWTHDPPITLGLAMGELEVHRDRLRRCHVCFTDGSRLVLDRHQFHSFHPSVRLRKRRARKMGTGTDRIIREVFRFSDYEEWAETLARDIETFREVHTIAPTLLAASPEVFVEMDKAAQSRRDTVVDAAGNHPSRNECFELSGFTLDGIEVEFVVTETTVAPEYLLIYDPEPDFDGEPFVLPGTACAARARKLG